MYHKCIHKDVMKPVELLLEGRSFGSEFEALVLGVNKLLRRGQTGVCITESRAN